MADDNKINYDSELTPEEKAEIQEALKNLSNEDIQNDEDFIKDIYGQADNDMSKVYEENKKNKESILNKISKVLLYYTIADNVLKLSNGEYKSLFSNFSKTIVDMFKNHSELTKNVMEDTLNNVATKVTDKYNLKKNQKQREKLVNEKYYGQHFSERVWDNEQEVAKQIQLEIKNLLLGKVSANQIAKNIKVKFDSNEYNAKRLADTEISRIQDSLFRQKCHETGAKYVLYKATFCRTCKTCRSHHNITYKIDNAPLIPLHPNCHCYYTIVDNPTKAMNLQLFAVNEKSLVEDLIKSGNIEADTFYKNLDYYNKLFKKDVETPIGTVKDKKERFYHIVRRHPELNSIEGINNIFDTLNSPDFIYKTIDKFNINGKGYLKDFNGRTLLVIVRNGIITAYYPSIKYLNNNVKSGELLWGKE